MTMTREELEKAVRDPKGWRPLTWEEKIAACQSQGCTCEFVTFLWRLIKCRLAPANGELCPLHDSGLRGS